MQDELIVKNYKDFEDVQYYDKQLPEAAAKGIYISGATDNVTMWKRLKLWIFKMF